MIPQSAVPKTPMPVQTAYTVPIGSVFADIDIRKKLSIRARAVGIVGRIFVNPFFPYLDAFQVIAIKVPIKPRTLPAEFQFDRCKEILQVIHLIVYDLPAFPSD